MERLETALAKAREMRRTSAHFVRSDSAIGGRGGNVRRLFNWSTLPEVEIPPEHAAAQLIPALFGGQEAAPYDLLRSRSLRLMRQNRWRRLAVTSPGSGCGKTTLALNLALSLVRDSDLRVMLLDLDLRRPALGRLATARDTRSFHEVLTGQADFADAALRIGENLLLAVNHESAQRPAEILHSTTTRDVLEAIEADWRPDLMIFDLSPMMVADDNVGFLGNADCALMVAASEKTSLTSIDRCEKELAQLTNVLGVVLNKCRYADETMAYGADAYE